MVPKGVNLSYTETYVRSGVTWFKVRYNSLTGWLMGTYVSAAGNASSPAIGTVTITMPGTRVRDAADGKKTGTVLAKGTVVTCWPSLRRRAAIPGTTSAPPAA